MSLAVICEEKQMMRIQSERRNPFTTTTYTILLHLTIAAKGLQLLAQLLEYLLRLLGHGKIEEDNLFKGAQQENNHKNSSSSQKREGKR